MKKLLLLLLLLTSPVFGQAWVRTHTALRTIYATSNSNFGKLFESATANYMGLEDNPSVRYNDIEMVSGAAGNAVSITGNTCTGTCDEPYAQLYYADTLDDTTWSVSWWFNSSSAVGGNMWASWATTGPQLAAVVTCNITSLGQVTCSVKDDAAVTFTITTTGTDKTNGSWHHAVLVAEAANVHRLYIDGVLNVSNTTTTIGAKTEMGALVLNPNGSSAYTGNYIGLIDELQIYSDAKNAANVTTLYNAGTPNVAGLANITTHYHFNEVQPGLDTEHRIDFDQIDAWIRPGDEVLLEAVNADPGYLSDRPKSDIDYTCEVSHPAALDQPWVERFCYLGPWYTITKSGTQANPILFKCEGDWPSDCRFQSRVEFQGDFQWVWGMWFTGVQGNNTVNCKTSDNGPASVSLEGRGSALINNWLYHPANFPLVTSTPTSPQAYKSDLDHNFDFDAFFAGDDYLTSYAPSSSLDGYTGGFFTQQAQGPERVVYGNIMNGGGHGIYSQNDYNGSGYAYYIQNMYQNQGEEFACDPHHFPAAESTASKIAGYWSTSNEVSGFYIYNNFFADMEGAQAGEFFHVSQGDPSHHSIIDSNDFFCGGRMLSDPNNGRISFGTGNGVHTNPTGVGHPGQYQITNNFAASCALQMPYLHGRGEVIYPYYLPTTVTGNTFLLDTAIVGEDDPAVFVRTSAYTQAVPAVRSNGIPLIRLEDSWNLNTYVTDADFDLQAGNVSYTGRTLTQWKGDTLLEGASGVGFDAGSTASTDYPVTGSRVVLYKNEYDPTIGNLMIYNWAGAATVGVNFTAVCPLCSRFDVYDADERPDSAPVMSNVVNLGVDIPVPMGGDLVKLFRIHILSGE